MEAGVAVVVTKCYVWRVEKILDPIGRDTVVQFPGGVNMQLYVHNTAPSYNALETVPENRVYVSLDSADALIHSFLAFSARQGRLER